VSRRGPSDLRVCWEGALTPQKNMEGSTKDALMVRDCPVDNNKRKLFYRKYNSKGRSQSLVYSMRRCFKCGKYRN
jgi:hypothetical protein